MTILNELNELFIPGEVYDRLKNAIATGMEADWSDTLNDDYVSLFRIIKAYNAIGLLIDEGMISEPLVVRQIWSSLLQRYADLRPIFDAQMDRNEGVRSLLERCQAYIAEHSIPMPQQHAASPSPSE